MRGFVLSTPGSSVARAVGIGFVMFLLPLPAWTEESPEDPAAPPARTDDDARPAPIEPSDGPLEAPPPATTQLTTTQLENPWRQPFALSLAPAHAEACTPWSGSSGCFDELEMLVDPWFIAPAQAPQPVAPVGSTPADPQPQSLPLDQPPSAAADGGKAEGGDQALPLPRVDDGPDRDPRLPTAEEVWSHRASAESAIQAPCAAGSTDSWVVDLGLPEAPFD